MLKLKTAQLSPFAQPGFNIVWQDKQALIWCWDEAQRAHRWASAKRRTSLPRAIVESRLYSPPPQQPCTRLIKLGEGYEGQHWQQAQLTASHWWLQPPNTEQWSRFLRGASQPSVEVKPEIETPILQQRPWGRERAREQVGSSGLERFAWRSVAALFLLACGWELSRFKQHLQASEQLNRSLAKQTAKIEHILQARDQALQDRQQLNRLRQAWFEPIQLELLDAVIAKLPRPQHNQITQWDYRPGELLFVVEGDNLDPSRVVRAYESLPWGGGVTAEPNPKKAQMKITMTLGAVSE